MRFFVLAGAVRGFNFVYCENCWHSDILSLLDFSVFINVLSLNLNFKYRYDYVYFSTYFLLRIFAGKKHPPIKLQRLQRAQIWTFGSLVHQINSLQDVLELKQNFQKCKVVTGKTPFSVIGPFCTHPSIS